MGTRKKEWDHPKETLYPEILTKTKGRVIRADTRIAAEKPARLTQNQWTEFKSRITGTTKDENDLWI